MNVREKLVELLEPHVSGLACEYESGSCELTSCRSCNARNIADHLISHGVTVQEWISVKERLPESEKESVLIALRWGEVDIGWCEDGRWRSEFVNEYEDGEVTHWMPLPELPKGE